MLIKKNKLPADKHSVDFELEYGKATIEVHKDSIKKNDKSINYRRFNCYRRNC